MYNLLYALIGLAAASGVATWAIVSLKRRKDIRLKEIDVLKDKIGEAFTEIGSYFNYGHYITESERLYLEEKYATIYGRVADLIGTKELKHSSYNEVFNRFYNALSDTASHKKTNNEHFIDSQLTANKEYFDTVLSHPLDEQQRNAIVSLEDNVLVISSAGSGKTMTTVGKVRYLIDKLNIPAEKILLITFTRKAAASLSERLGEKGLKCRTFHKLALEIIGESTGEKPTITPEDFPVQVYHKLLKENIAFSQAIGDYILNSRYQMRDRFEYSSMQDYMEDRKKYGVRAFFNDMNGRPIFCKSDEESKICDYLGSRGVNFLYEEAYELPTADANHRQYHPDFSIYIRQPDGKVKRVYLEHFAIDENGHCPAFFSPEEEDAYKSGIQWKRGLHHRCGTILIETTSGDFHRGDVFEKLGQKLQALGVHFRQVSNNDISRALAHQEENILEMLKAFTFLLKSREIDLSTIKSEVSGSRDRITLNSIIIPFVTEYRKIASKNNQLDFTDAILKATNLCNSGFRPDYDYILVDEFQDISLDRYRFLQSLRKDKPLTKLFCVGDDWQSIYRFAGSDMALFKHFEQYFGYTKKCLMETTYRFGEPTIKQSSRFILANPEQALKKVHAFNSDISTKLDFIAREGRSSVAKTIMSIADQVPRDKDIMLLGRYGFDINVLIGSDLDIHRTQESVYVTYGTRRMHFMTIHQSKGLECDYIILLNCNGGTVGFPSQISDNPVLKYVLSEPDAYAFSEERRIFYVAITRAKKQTWVLYEKYNPSLFVQEFVDARKLEPKKEVIPEEDVCPKCRCGRIIEVRRGRAVNGNPYTIYNCTNEKYGCDYTETVFINLNHSRRS